jgi:hypothetical protein
VKKCQVCEKELPAWFVYETFRNGKFMQICYVCGDKYRPFTTDSFIQKLDHQQLWQAFQNLEKYGIIGIPKRRLQLICRALGVLRDIDPEAIRLSTKWCSETCREVQATAKEEYPRLRKLIHSEDREI